MKKFRRSVVRMSGIVLALITTGCVEEYAFNQTETVKDAYSADLPTATPTAPVVTVSPTPVLSPTPTVTISPLPTPNSDLCVTNPEAPACKRDPVVSTPGVVSVLFTMSQIPQGSATLILVNAIKFASPERNPRILFLKDSDTHGEDEGDPDYIKNVLLAGYDVEYRVIEAGGLILSDTIGKDLIILSNPGHPLTDLQSLTTLNLFAGGVILLGDDLAHGAGFSMDAFTGLHFLDNGSSMTCNGQTYLYDNLSGYNYQIGMNIEFFAGIPAESQHYEYGNDLDITTAAPGSQVLAWGKAATGTCDIGNVPAVVRRPK